MLSSMAVMAREAWTDERLDDLSAHVDRRFDQVDQRFDRLEADIRELRVEMKNGFERIDGKFDGKLNSLQTEMNTRFESIQRTMIIGFVTLVASIVASVIGVAFAV
jgi:DNA anti-recombination protein RmuC